jgi:phospholipid-binding lipoprotein MlaA
MSLGPAFLSARAVALVLCLVGGLSGCAALGGPGRCDEGQNDPFEAFNRRVFSFDMALDRLLIKPVAKAYRSALPEFVRDGIHGIVTNLKEPLVFLNDLLQGRGRTAVITGKRFVINSTIGLAGLTDPASRWGLPRQSGDFGQTLYAWGLDDGPYLVLPLIGPSNVRDAFGLGVDGYASPLGHVGSADVRRDLPIAVGVADGIDLRARNIESLDELEKSSLDFYAYLRSVTRQERHSVLRQARDAPGADAVTGGDLLDPAATPAVQPPITPPPDVPASGGTPADAGSKLHAGNRACGR